MAGFADLVPKAQPALVGGGCTASATEGATWKFIISDVRDNSDALIDLTTATGSALIYDAVNGSQITALAFSGGLGTFTLSLDESLTVGLAGTTDSVRRAVWSLTITNGMDVVQVWSPSVSVFNIYPAVA